MGSKAAPTRAATAWRLGIRCPADAHPVLTSNTSIAMRGAGVVGLWQALTAGPTRSRRHAL